MPEKKENHFTVDSSTPGNGGKKIINKLFYLFNLTSTHSRNLSSTDTYVILTSIYEALYTACRPLCIGMYTRE